MTYGPLYLLTGLFAGVVAGLLGVGGGLINVPILDFLFRRQGVAADASFHLALGTSLAAIVFTAASAAWAHHRRGKVDVGFGWRAGVGGLAGAVLGGYVASLLPAATLKPAFAALLVAAAAELLRSQSVHAPGATGGAGKAYWIGALAGVVAGFFGIGGGIVAVPLLLWWARFDPPRAIATSTLMIVILGAGGAATYVFADWRETAGVPYAAGGVHLLALIFLAPAAIITAPVGAALGHRINPLRLKQLFALALLLVAGRFFWTLFERG
jgi:uncharacterized membrane protein YfcA